MERALLHHAFTQISMAAGDGGFHAPSLDEFFPPIVLFAGTPFALNRIMLIRLLVMVLLVLFVAVATRSLKVVPTRGSSIVEFPFNFVRNSIAYETLGERDGRRYLPLLTTIFLVTLGMNLTSVIPFLNIAGTSVIGLPLLMAVISWIAFIYAGLKKHPGAFIRNSLFPPGVPWPLYIIVTPIEFFSTFILRPVTLTLRLTMNMLVGHLLLVLFFSATWFFFFQQGPNGFTLFGIGTLVFGFAFTLFELFVAALQAYIFTLLTAVYLQLSLAEEH
ncbi:F0F1 ATP synthase subunit A [Amnibacterium soli]|jgi:F-type H+-transporting ATPase subunit a|uniref:ATP synthase subunit a n=1 Tax=Amnibacterium soli TaxID=1282736 RepID=A0ABP8YWH2_9MICO